MDEDFATFTYIARFQKEGLKWKKDAFLFLHPVWRMILINLFYQSSPEKGIQRIRKFLACQHGVTSVLVYFTAFLLTKNVWASGIAGMFYGFFATSPNLESSSINFEQCYLPFLLASIISFLLGPNYFSLSAIFLGLTIFTKVTTFIYVPVFFISIASMVGVSEALSFSLISIAPMTIALILDAFLGYFDKTSLNQMKTRMISTLNCANLNPTLDRFKGDIKTITKETLPIWILGIPSLLLTLWAENLLFLFGIIFTTFAMLWFQKSNSRYHYLPLISLLSVGSGTILNAILKLPLPLQIAFFLFGIITVFLSLRKSFPYYKHPMSPKSLSQYGKFQQMIYIPYLSKVLKKYLQIKGQKGKRICVWGNFIQIFHYTDCPSSDAFIHFCSGPWTHIVQTNFFDTFIGGLIKHQPLILIQNYQNLNIEVLKEITGLHYKLIKVWLTRYPIYRLSSINQPTSNPLNLPGHKKLQLMEKLTGNINPFGLNSLDVQNGRLKKALTECKKMLRLNPYDIEGKLFLSELLSESGEIDQSIRIFKDLVENSPNSPGLLALIAKQYIKLGNLEEAEFYIQKEIEKYNYNTTTHFVQGLILQANKNFHQAANHFEIALKENTKNWDLYYYLAKAKIEIGDRLQGQMILEKIRKEASSPNFSSIRNQACILLAQLQSDTIPEHESLQNYYLEDLENQNLMYSLGSALERYGQNKEALKIFTELTDKLKPGHLSAAAWFRRARLSPLDEQKSMFEKCLKQNSNHREARRMLNSLEVIHAQT